MSDRRILKHRDLNDWLSYITTLHARVIDLGLTRLAAVTARLMPLKSRVITVAGTNGKGSTVAFLEHIYRASGYRVGAYFSPHLIRYNERVRILGEEIDDATLCAAFAEVERARADTPLTYFEFGTLAAFVAFAGAHLDVVILEVGLGGRLDAVNVVDSDVGVVVSVGTDHKDWLGADRETIGREKAGIFRSGRPAILGADMPESVRATVRDIGARAVEAGRDFRIQPLASQWRYESARGVRDLPYPVLRGVYQLNNAACAIAATEALDLPVQADAVRKALTGVRLSGRFQTLPGRPLVVLDVAHNAEAAAVLAHTLATQPVAGRTGAVVGMLRDKPIEEVLVALMPRMDFWHVASVEDPRGADGATLAAVLAAHGAAHVTTHADVATAFAVARSRAREEDRIVVFGSFKTVGAILACMSTHKDQDG